MIVPRAVVFDLGKVLVDFDYSIAARRIAARGKMTIGEIAQYINQSPLFVQYESGRVTTEQFYQEIRTVTGFKGDLAEFSDCFADIFVAIEPMVQLQAALRRKGLGAYVVSNIFFFNDTAINEIYTLSLHDALPISKRNCNCNARIDQRTSSGQPAARNRS